jgi:hypothetical protein
MFSLTCILMLKVGPMDPVLTKYSYESYMSARLCEMSCFHVFVCRGRSCSSYLRLLEQPILGINAEQAPISTG